MDVDLDQYKDYKIYTKLYKEGDDNIQLRKVINGYHRFIKYLFDSSSTIDYTYLWDIVCSGILMKQNPQSINMIILKDNDNDITNNISVICPTSKVSKYLYNKNRNSIILYCKENSNKEIYYEPIVTLTETKDTKNTVDFSISEKQVHHCIIY